MSVASKKRIFLVGCPRSGTTLLQRMLDAHPDVAIAPETYFIRHFYLKRQEYGNLEKDDNYYRLIENIIAIPEFAEMEIDAQNFREASKHISRQYSTLFALLLDSFASIRKVSVVGEKTPNHLLYMQTLEEFFPEAYFIHIIRDPRAVVNSWRKVPWSNGSVSADAEVWRRYLETARLYPPRKSPLFPLFYEKLVSNPEAILHSLCDFLNLPFAPEMLDYHLQVSQTVNVDREPWKNQTLKPISQDSLTLWQQDLSSSQIADIEAVALPEMKRLEYQLATPSPQIWLKATPIQLKRQLKQFKRQIMQTIKSIQKK